MNERNCNGSVQGKIRMENIFSRSILVDPYEKVKPWDSLIFCVTGV